MADKIDMSLEDIIKGDKTLKFVGRGRGGNRGNRRGARGLSTGNRGNNNSFRGNRGGPSRGGIQKRRPQSTGAIRNNNQNNVNGTWKHDMFDGVSRNNSGDGRLLVSNLDFGVNDSDIKELFSEFGPLKKAAVHYDRSGRSSGTAEVHFEKRNDAIRALKQYNNVPLDGRAMDIKLVGIELKERNNQPSRPANFSRGQRRGTRSFRRGASSGGRGRGAKNPTLTSDELDKQLDAYNNRMEIE